MSKNRTGIEPWLQRLRWALADMPAEDRDEILGTTEAHLRDALAAGQSAEQALSGFGEAEEFARRHFEQAELSGALGSSRSGPMLRVLVRRMHRSVVALLAVAVVLACLIVSLASLVLVVHEILDPVHTGLWRGGGNFFIGVIDDPASASDLLGNGLFPAAAAATALALLVGRIVLTLAMKSLARPS